MSVPDTEMTWCDADDLREVQEHLLKAAIAIEDMSMSGQNRGWFRLHQSCLVTAMTISDSLEGRGETISDEVQQLVDDELDKAGIK